MLPPIPRLQFAAFLVLVSLASGCIRSKTFWQNRMDGSGTLSVGGEYQSNGLKPPLVLTDGQITNRVTGTVTNEHIRVSYESGLQPHAAVVANLVNHSFRQTEDLLGASPHLDLHLYLLRLPNERRAIQFHMSLPAMYNTIPWLLPLTNLPAATPPADPLNDTNFWTDLQELPLQIFIVAHEAWELHLVNPGNFLVMPDINGQFGSVKWSKWSVRHHTRWFRDGFATYAGYKASQFLRQSTEKTAPPGALHYALRTARPMAELARHKDKIFDWDQDSKENYYDASFALFLLLEQHLGPESISAIVRELPQVRFPQGRALLKMVRQKTGLDLRQIARTFEFPDLGIEIRDEVYDRLEIASVLPGSWAARADLHEGDILLEANRVSLPDLVQLELQLLKALQHRQPLALTISRHGTELTTELLPCCESVSPETSSPPIPLSLSP